MYTATSAPDSDPRHSTAFPGDGTGLIPAPGMVSKMVAVRPLAKARRSGGVMHSGCTACRTRRVKVESGQEFRDDLAGQLLDPVLVQDARAKHMYGIQKAADGWQSECSSSLVEKLVSARDWPAPVSLCMSRRI